MSDQRGQSDAGAKRLTRAAFLRLAGAAAVAAGAAPWLGPRRVAHAAPAASPWVLQLDGSPAGRLHAFSGGSRIAGPGGIALEPMKMLADFGLADSFYTWIASITTGQATSRDGTVSRTDKQGAVLGEMRFVDAVLTEVAIPGCDASSTAPGFLSVTALPAAVRHAHPTQTIDTTLPAAPWREADFKLSINGFANTGVTRIDPFTIRQLITIDHVGGKPVIPSLGTPVFPDLSVFVPAHARRPWLDWRRAVAGHHIEERDGTLVLLAPNHATARMKVQLVGLLPTAVTRDAANNLTVQLSCRAMSLQFAN
jgi:hypothetical protein